MPGSSPATLTTLAAVGGAPVCLLLDYDGTLVPIAPTPAEARPDPALLDLLRALCARPRTRVEVVSGRPREDLDAWLGTLPMGLWAEHGYWHRASGDASWSVVGSAIDRGWLVPIRALFDGFQASTPGSSVEVKSASMADRKSTRLNSSHSDRSRMPSSA